MADDKLDPLTLALARELMAASRVEDLKADAAELSALYAELDESERERMKVLVFGPEV